MKKIILGCFLLASAGSFAQVKSQENKTAPHTEESTCAFTMADGKMLIHILNY